jgi:hypothetical protein
MLVYLYTFRIDKRFSDWGRVFGIEFFQIPVLSPILGSAEKVFPGGWVWGVGCGVWGFTHFHLVNYLIFREKVPEFSPQSLQGSGLFEVKKV